MWSYTYSLPRLNLTSHYIFLILPQCCYIILNNQFTPSVHIIAYTAAVIHEAKRYEWALSFSLYTIYMEDFICIVGNL